MYYNVVNGDDEDDDDGDDEDEEEDDDDGDDDDDDENVEDDDVEADEVEGGDVEDVDGEDDDVEDDEDENEDDSEYGHDEDDDDDGDDNDDDDDDYDDDDGDDDDDDDDDDDADDEDEDEDEGKDDDDDDDDYEEEEEDHVRMMMRVRMVMTMMMMLMMMMRRRRRIIIIGTEPRTTLCASLHSPNACPHVTRDIRRATLYGIYRKIFAAQTGPRTWTHTLWEPAQSKCMSTRHKSQKSHFIEKCRNPDWAERRRTLCASLRSRNACPHVTRVRRATLYRNLQEKCRGPDWAQNADEHFVRACALEMHVKILRETSEEPLCTEIYRKNPAAQIGPRMQTHILCEPAQSKRMPGFHKSHFIRNLQVKCRRPEWAPWSSTGPYSYSKNPSVWTHCLGNQKDHSHAHSITCHPSWSLFFARNPHTLASRDQNCSTTMWLLEVL